MNHKQAFRHIVQKYPCLVAVAHANCESFEIHSLKLMSGEHSAVGWFIARKMTHRSGLHFSPTW